MPLFNHTTILVKPTPTLTLLSRLMRSGRRPQTVRLLIMTTLSCSALTLSGCWGDNNNSSVTTQPMLPVKYSDATLIEAPVTTKVFTAAQLKAAVDAAGLQSAVDQEPLCGITVEYINHTTTGLKGEATNATGAVILPNGDNPNCQGDRPIMLYAHGTTPFKTYNLAALNDPDNPAYDTALLIAANFAGRGDIVIAPNYPGYDKSTLSYAPYVTAKQGLQMLDGLQAGKLAIEQLAKDSEADKSAKASQPVRANDKVFITGYSQGGYVAMATAKALDEIGHPATAVSPASGPYAITAFADSIMAGHAIYGGTLFLPMLTSSYEAEYGNINEGVYSDKYAATAPTIFPTTQNIYALFLSGKIPTTQLFQSSPTGYPILDELPAPGAKYAFGFDPSNYLFNTQFRANYVQDMTSYPDGIYPTFIGPTAAVPAKSDLPARRAFIANDLRSYQPKSPMLLCGGNQDPSVTYDVNADAQARIWQATSKQPFALIDVDTTNQDTRSQEGKLTYISTLPNNVNAKVNQAALNIQNTFATNLSTMLTNSYQVAYSQAITKGKSEAEAKTAGNQARYSQLLSSYHGMLAPYCLSAANTFFDEYR
ncbi:MAG: hypothetical protein Q4P13_07725 [Psychrobacter sp.]|nr:hypothetical protein [Psychrobacter sp.]